ncbi:NAD(P)-dependent alcohol dehydrogenase [Parvularcula sp. LCG005]|uniref:zinc-dependent alcohol dehydrogenase family protein n=1 Tax=Parvularcula sp. LCG005 TaxID=3078805 RepID=UPI002942EB97|nr:NAD(P)-dependent alcohol dehydrogenase [Parvularcula sp. LCG005]WOI53528.1 NAD(P)-dependent alcohol dehydrogenase [Parvularcula sp. LCG005]
MKQMTLKAPAGLDQLTLVDADDPGAPGRGEVRVRIHASSLNFHDFGVVSGRMPSADGRIPLSDGAGVVEAVGDGVTEFKEGDRVVSTFFPYWADGEPTIGDFSQTPGDGIDGFASEVVVRPVSAFTLAPEGWSHEEAATITTAGLTAWRALIVHGGLKAGDTVLTLGTGGVSIFALQIAKAMGARVAITSSSDEKLTKAKELGADFTVNYRTHEEWYPAIEEWTHGHGVDHVIELGGPGTLPQSISAARIGGQIHLIGVLTGASGNIPTANFMRKQQSLRGLIVGNRRQQQDFVKALENTGIRPVIDSVYPLEQLADAFRHEEAGKHFGKIAVSI